MDNHAWGEHKILSFLKEGRQLYRALYWGDADAPIPPPRFISCWISEKCNLDCTYCYFSDTNADKTHLYIDQETFLKWLSEAFEFGAESLEFSGGGEPTLHPKFKDIYTGARNIGYKLGLITHGCNDMPLKDMSKEFKYVRFGLDAATVETHDLIKRNKRKNYWFHKAIENIKELVKLKKPEFTVGIKVVLNSVNYHELRDMISLAKELKTDYIQIKAEHSSDHAISDADRAFGQRIIDLEAQFNGNGGTRVLGTLYHQRASVKCFMSPIHTVVTATGKILQCCFFEDRPIGTISQPFQETWGSEQHRKVINSTKVHECDKVDCRWHSFNHKMKETIEDPLSSISFI